MRRAARLRHVLCPRAARSGYRPALRPRGSSRRSRVSPSMVQRRRVRTGHRDDCRSRLRADDGASSSAATRRSRRVPATVVVTGRGRAPSRSRSPTNAAAPPHDRPDHGCDPERAAHREPLGQRRDPAGPSLSSVSATPSTLTGGSAATGTVTFTGATERRRRPARRAATPRVVQVPTETVVNGGASSGAFAVTTVGGHAPTRRRRSPRRGSASPARPTITRQPGRARAGRPGRDHEGAAGSRACSRSRPRARTRTRSCPSSRQSGGFMFTLTNKGGGQLLRPARLRHQPARSSPCAATSAARRPRG